MLQADQEIPPDRLAPATTHSVLPQITPPCDIRTMAGSNDTILILDRCGTVIKWNPNARTAASLKLEDQPVETYDLAVASKRIAILCDDRSVIRVYDKSGALLEEHRDTGSSFLTRIALTDDTVAASSYYDDSLLFLFKGEGQEPLRLIENPRYWPESSPRFSSHVEVHVHDGIYYAYDLGDFTLYQVDPKSLSVAVIPKEKHPWWRPVAKPEKMWGEEGSHYTDPMLAVDSTIEDGHLYVLMLDRTLVEGAAKPGDGFLELAASRLQEKDWSTLARLDDPQQFGGSLGLSVVGSGAYLFRPDGSIYAVELPVQPG